MHTTYKIHPPTQHITSLTPDTNYYNTANNIYA